VSENEVIDSDETAAKRIAAVFVAWNESGESWCEFVEGLRATADEATAAYQTAVACVPPGGQLPLIPGAAAATEPRKPRAKRRQIMHKDGQCFICPACGETAPVPEDMTASARKRGIPCSKCNGPAAEERSGE
jgi:hypothetical protein